MPLPKQKLILFCILALALIVRVRYITEIEHNVDHAYTVWQGMTTLYDGEFPLAGQGTSVLFANPPLTGYFYIPLIAITPIPLGIYVWVVMLNWLGVWLTYKAARVILNENMGLMAAALMAVNPWIIEFSRTSWVQALLPFFVPLVAWLLWGVLIQKTRIPVKRMALALMMLTLLAHTYLLAFFILAPIGLLMLIFWRRIPWRGVWIGGAFFVVIFGLYVLGLVNQADTVANRVESFSSGESRISTEAFEHALRLVSGAGYEVARGLSAPADDFQLRYDLTQPMTLIVSLAVLLGSGAAAYEIFKRGQRHDAAIILLVWFFAPILAMTYSTNVIHPMYLMLTLPAGYALAAWGFNMLMRPKVMTYAITIAFIPFVALMLTNSARYYQETNAIPGAHDFSALPVDVGMRIGAAVDENLPPDGIAYIDVDEWIINSFSERLFKSVRDVRAPEFSVIPLHGGVYIQMMPDDAPIPYGAERVEAMLLNDGNRVTIDRLPAAADLVIDGERLDIPTQQGITLLTYDLWQDEETWHLRTFWRVDAVMPEVLELIYAPFIHVFNAAGERILIVDGQGLAGYEWSVGDIHVHEMRFEASEPFTLQVGQYDGLHNAGLIFFPPDAEPTTAITLRN